MQISNIKIRRHTKIRKEANPYDPAYTEYFTQRKWKVKIEDSDNPIPAF